MARLAFTVLGHPEPGGSKRSVAIPGGGHKIIDANRKVMPWRDSVASAAQAAMTDAGLDMYRGALAVQFTFYMRRPLGHYGTGRNSDQVKRSAPKRPATRPDVTKLIRAVEDACTTIVWRDDAQIVTQLGRKMYGSPERCEVTVQEYGLPVNNH